MELSDGSIGFKIKKPFDFLSQTASIKTWYSQGGTKPLKTII
jgi:hypothetical protein